MLASAPKSNSSKVCTWSKRARAIRRLRVVVRATLDLVLQEELQEVQVAQVAILGLVDALFDGGEHAAQLEELELLL